MNCFDQDFLAWQPGMVDGGPADGKLVEFGQSKRSLLTGLKKYRGENRGGVGQVENQRKEAVNQDGCHKEA